MRKLTSTINPPQPSLTRHRHVSCSMRPVLLPGILLAILYSGHTYSANASDDFATTAYNSTVSIPVLRNDIVGDGIPASDVPNASVCLDPRKFNSACTSNDIFFTATSPENGFLSLSGNTVIYTPEQGFAGTDSFTYTLFYPANGQYEWDAATVRVTVQEGAPNPGEEPNEPPAEEPTTPPGEEPTEPPAEEPTTPPGEEPTEPPAEEPTTPPGEEPTEPPAEEPTTPPGEEPTEPPAEEPTEEMTEEQKLVNAINSLCSGGSENEFNYSSSATTQGDVNENCATLNNLPADEQTQALITLAADQVTAGYSSSISLSRNQSANISARLTQLRNNTPGLSLQGLTINNYGDTLNGDWLQAAYTSLSEDDFNHPGESGGGAGNSSGNSAYTPFGFFINGSITLGEKDSNATERGYDLDSDNYTLGVDYRFSDQLVMGAAYGYSSSSIEFNSTGDDMDNQVNNLFVYGSLYDDNYFFSSTLGYAFGEIDTSRRIQIGNFETQAKGTTDSSQLMLQLNGRYDINRGALSFGPYAKLDIIEGKIKSYAETNGGGFEVAFDEQDISSQLLTLGGQAQYAISYSWGVLLPTARFELKNEFNDSQDAINARFVFDSANTQFSITADEIDNLWYIFGTGLSAIFPYGLSAYVDFETTTGLDRLDLYTYSFGGRWELLF